MSSSIYEKLDLFYLGKDLDRNTMKPTDVLTLIKNKAFTTHAAIIGMTGSGKTGLGVGLVEEASLDNIPSIVIDPKGDMGNLCLVDSDFNPASFVPWVTDEAMSKEKDPLGYAKEVAASWEEGIESFGQDKDRTARFQAVAKTIYTPGSSAGVSVNVMSSIDAPPAEILEDSDLFSLYLKTTVFSLLALLDIEADPVNSKEYILLSQIISESWVSSQNISIETLIGSIIKPSFDKIGVLRLDDYYSADARFALASKFNALIASTQFQAWMQGEVLDIKKLLYDENGKAKVAIFNISHLNDSERMFFVSLLLNRYTAWMRLQSGTEILKTIFYMDEIFGFFPPSKNPPSKEPMLLLLKQARAFGIGVILSTQNPVDLDYKGLANIGTWFIGRLQTTQDIDKIIDGLSGQIGASFSKDEIRSLLSNLPKRSFFLRSTYLDDIRLFITRWTLSYLKGPLKREEIISLMSSKKTITIKQKPVDTDIQTTIEPLDENILQYFESGTELFNPTIGAKVSIYYYQQSKGIDEKKEFFISLPLNVQDSHLDWSCASKNDIDFTKFATKAPANASFASLPEFIKSDKGLKKAIDSLTDWLYQNENIEILACKSLNLESKPNESRADFMVRVSDGIRVKKDEAISKLTAQFETKEKGLSEKLQRANEQIEKEKTDSTGSMLNTGIAVIGALFGGSSNASKLGKVVSHGSRLFKENDDVNRVKERAESIQDEIKALEEELKNRADEIASLFVMENYEVESVVIKPRKSDISIAPCALVWRA
ncbi:MAG: DUF87 domain-containing protein [Sulfurovaceae bacterium]|nr:DUF87 domain-containing protein [Sulfurovaceae bacterium]